MEFTNDIKFNKQPISNDILTLTYSGKLFKDNSNEVYIVYGFGENWDNTTEQKMEKNEIGFIANIEIKNYNTFNFCFRNDKYIWDNNNSFNYISGITAKTYNTEMESLSNEEAQKVCSSSIDNILNSIDLNLETNPTQTIETTEENSVLDALIQELFEEYNSNIVNTVQTQEIENTDITTSLSNETTKISESEFDQFFEEVQEENELSNTEYFSELSQLFDEIIENIEKNTNSVQTIDVGNELNNIFENTFVENFEPQTQNIENFIPENTDVDVFTDNEDLNKTFSDIVKNISEVETKTNSEVKNLNYDYSDFNEMFAFAQRLNKEEVEEENIFDFSNLDFDFEMNTNNITCETNEEIIENNSLNNFSDSFYDDEDVSIHESYTNFQEIVNNITNELDQEVSKVNLCESEDFAKENEDFEAAISEYTQYFDNLIEEIISTPTTSLSTPVSTAQVLENENTTLAVIENSNTEIATSSDSYTENSTDGVPDEYALYDYKSHSFFYMFKRRFKMVVSTIFSKLPKIFGKQTNTENN